MMETATLVSGSRRAVDFVFDAPITTALGPSPPAVTDANFVLNPKTRQSSSSVVGQKAAFFEAQIKVQEASVKTNDTVAAKLNRFKSLPTTIRIPRDEPRAKQQSARESYEQHIREKMRQSMPPILQARYFGAVQRSRHGRTPSTVKRDAEEAAAMPPPTVPSSLPPRAASVSVSGPSVLFRASNYSTPAPVKPNVPPFSSSPSISPALPPTLSRSPSPSLSPSLPPSLPSLSPSLPPTPAPVASTFPSLRPLTVNPVPLSPPPKRNPSSPTFSQMSSAAAPTELQSPSRRVRSPPMARTWGSGIESKTPASPTGPTPNIEAAKDIKESADSKQALASAAIIINEIKTDQKHDQKVEEVKVASSPVEVAVVLPSTKVEETSAEKPIWEVDDVVVVAPKESEKESEKVNVWDIDDMCVVDTPTKEGPKEPSLLEKIKSVSVNEEAQRFAEYALLDFVVIRLPETRTVKGILRPPDEKRQKKSLDFDLKEAEMPNCMFEQEEQEREEEEARKKREAEEEEDSGSPLDDDGEDSVPQFLVDDGEDEGDDEEDEEEEDEGEGDPATKKKPDINPLDAWKRAMEEKTLKLRELNANPTPPIAAAAPTSGTRTFRVAPRPWAGIAKIEPDVEKTAQPSPMDIPSSPQVTPANPQTIPASPQATPASPMSETGELGENDNSDEDAEPIKQRRIKSKKKLMLDRAKSGGTITKGFGKNSVKIPDSGSGESALDAWKRAMEDKTAKMKAIQAARVSQHPTEPDSNATASPGDSKKRILRPAQPKPAASLESTSDTTQAGGDDGFDAFSAWTKAMEEKTQKMKAAAAAKPPPAPPPVTKVSEETPVTAEATATPEGQRRRAIPRPWSGSSAQSPAAEAISTTITPPEILQNSTTSTPVTPTFDTASMTPSDTDAALEPKTPTRMRARVQPRAWAGAAAAILADHKEKEETPPSSAPAPGPAPTPATSAEASQAEPTSLDTWKQAMEEKTQKMNADTVEVPAVATDPVTPRRARAKVQPRTWGTASFTQAQAAQAQAQIQAAQASAAATADT